MIMSEFFCSHLYATFLFVYVSMYIANKDKIASLRGIEAIIKSLSTHSDNAAVQDKACGALNHLAANDGMPTRLEAGLHVYMIYPPFWACAYLHCFFCLCGTMLGLHAFSLSRQTVNDAGWLFLCSMILF